MTETLPKATPLPGSVCAQYRTANGNTYGPYYFRFWREGGSLRKAYVPRDTVNGTMLACALWTVRKEEGSRESRRRRLRVYKAMLAALPGRLDWEVERDERRKRERRERRRKARAGPVARPGLDAAFASAMDHLEWLFEGRA